MGGGGDHTAEKIFTGMQKLMIEPDTGFEELYYKVGDLVLEAQTKKQDRAYIVTLKNAIPVTKDRIGMKSRVELHTKAYGMNKKVYYLGDYAFTPSITIIPTSTPNIYDLDDYYPTFKLKVIPDIGEFIGDILATYKPRNAVAANGINLAPFGGKFTRIDGESTSEYGIYQMTVDTPLEKTSLGLSSPNPDDVTETYTFYHSAFNNSISITQMTHYVVGHIYGVEWDGTRTTKLSRINDSSDFSDPVPYILNATNYGSPFDTLMPWAGMIRVTDAEAGELVAIPKFYYKWTKSGKSLKLQIADRPIDGFYTSPAHADRDDGKRERDIVYVGRYHCSKGYKSESKVMPLGRITRNTARSGIHNLGINIFQFDFAMWLTIRMLYLVEFADWDSQTKIGYGCGNNSAVENVGYTDFMPYHTGTMQSSRSIYGLGTQYRYIEGLWDNVYDWVDGCYYNSEGISVIINPSVFNDSENGIFIGMPTHGWISAFDVIEAKGLQWIISSGNGGSSTTYVPDYWNFNASAPCLHCGGNFYQYLYRGLFYVVSTSIDGSGSGIGCRLQKLP